MVNPSIWGPNIWQTMHFISLGYPEYPSQEEKEAYKQFFLLLKIVLPCKICAAHLKQNLENVPLTDKALSNKKSFITWVIDLHNSVNVSKDKPIVNYSKAFDLITKASKCYHNNKEYCDNFFNIFIFLIIILILFLLYKYNYLKL